MHRLDGKISLFLVSKGISLKDDEWNIKLANVISFFSLVIVRSLYLFLR